MDIGNKIKTLRTHKGITQETLAAALGVSMQAVSKWETGASLPDIELIPKLAIYFGITTDELFCLGEKSELERIANMADSARLLSDEELGRAVNWLGERIRRGEGEGECRLLRAELYNHQARMYHLMAADEGKAALAAAPGEKGAHQCLMEAMGGYVPD